MFWLYEMCIRDRGKACIIVVNKWDAVEGKETNTMELQRRGYAECFSFMGYAPIIFISAQTLSLIHILARRTRSSTMARSRKMSLRSLPSSPGMMV